MPIVEGPFQNFAGVQFPFGWEIIREHNWLDGGAEAYIQLFPQAPTLFTSIFSPTHRFDFITDPKCGGFSRGHHYVYMRRVLPPTPTGWQVTVDSRGVGSLYDSLPDDWRASQGPTCKLWLNGEQQEEDGIKRFLIFRRRFSQQDNLLNSACATGYRPIGGDITPTLRGLPVEVDISPEGGNLDLLVSSTFTLNYENLVDTQASEGWPILDILDNPSARLAYRPDTAGHLVNDKGARPGAYVELDIRIRRKPGKTVTP